MFGANWIDTVRNNILSGKNEKKSRVCGEAPLREEARLVGYIQR